MQNKGYFGEAPETYGLPSSSVAKSDLVWPQPRNLSFNDMNGRILSRCANESFTPFVSHITGPPFDGSP